MTKRSHFPISDLFCAPVVALAALDPSGDGSVWIKIMPAGEFVGRTGRGPFVSGNLETMRGIVDASLRRAGATELMVDYDHQSLFGVAAGAGGRAPAAGWVRQLEAREDGIWARVEWTAAASQAIQNGEYRYISPTYLAATPTKGGVRAIISVALTNVPDLDLAAVAASALVTLETENEMKNIAKALGLAEDASEVDIIAAANALATSNSALVAACGATRPEDAVASITAMRTASESQPDPARFVPVDQVVAMQADLAALKARDTEAVVNEAIAAGKLQPALKSWGADLHASNPVAFSAYLEKAPAITIPQKATAASPAKSDAELSDSDIVVMSQMGLSREAFLNEKKKAGEA